MYFTKIFKSTFQHSALLHQKLSTVFALSSGLGRCGVAVIRVSGSEASEAIKKLTINNLPQPRLAVLRSIKDPQSRDVIDKGLILWFPGPKSFTGEDSCEFHVHGSSAVVSGILNALGSLANFKLAEPGEFTKRAFLNGKFDLTEVEGLADLLHAETEAQRKQAFLQLDGSLSKLYKKWRNILKQSVAHIEAHIDFDETDTNDYNIAEVERNIKLLSHEVTKHLESGRKGELLRSGVRTVIIGEPNVGKSSLLNLLCQRPAAIVTPISGTTRDVIEVTLDIAGYPLILSDTAGLRDSSQDIIEIEGMSRSIENYKKADLIVLVIDFSSYLAWHRTSESPSFKRYICEYVKTLGLDDFVRNNPENEPWNRMFNKDCIVVLNKIDLDRENTSANIDDGVVKLSCKNEDGITNLVETLSIRLKDLCGEPSQEHPSMNQVRHRLHLTKCYDRLQLFLMEKKHIKGGADAVIMAEHLRMALRSIGRLTGVVTSEDILDVIFKDFCIGK